MPGIGKIRRLVLLSDIHEIARFPRVQDFASSCRLVTCAHASAGKRSGTSGSTIGNAHLTWAFSEAAVFFLRDNPAGQTLLTRWEKTHRTGNALTILAHPLARAVSYLRQRQTAFALETVLQASGRGVGALHTALDSQGMPLIRHAHSRVNPCVAERS